MYWGLIVTMILGLNWNVDKYIAEESRKKKFLNCKNKNYYYKVWE